MSSQTDMAVLRLEEAWDSHHVWDVMHEISPIVKENPEAFYKFIGRELPLRERFYSGWDSNNLRPESIKVRLVDLLTYTKTGTNEKASFTFESMNSFYVVGNNGAVYSSEKFGPETAARIFHGSYTDYKPLKLHCSPDSVVALGSTSLYKHIPKVAFPSYAYGDINPRTVDAYEARPSVIEIFGEAVATNPAQGYGNKAWGKAGRQFKFYKDNPGADKRLKTCYTSSSIHQYYLRDCSNNTDTTDSTSYPGMRPIIDASGNLVNASYNTQNTAETCIFCVD